MPKPVVDPAVCVKCGTCVMTCPEKIFVRDDPQSVPAVVHDEICTVCGHCVAMCPSGAISHTGFPADAFTPIRQDLLPSAEQVLEMLRKRRSIRVFEDKAIPKELVEQVIAAATLAPSAHNTQDTEYVVIQDKAIIAQIANCVARYFAKTAKQLRNPIAKMVLGMKEAGKLESALHLLPDLDMIVEAAAQGEDLVFRGAPCVIVAHAPDSVNYPDANATLALHNATLAAEALGLGSFHVGYLTGTCKRDRAVLELLSLSKGHRVFGTLAMGYPRITFPKWIRPRPPKIRFL